MINKAYKYYINQIKNKFFILKLAKKLKIFPKALLTLNIIFLLLNIFSILSCIINHNKSQKIFFNDSNIFIFEFLKQPYNVISAYLNHKFKININKTERKKKQKKIIKIKCTGLFNITHHLKWLKSKLDDEFQITIDENNPDYLIYNVFNNEDQRLIYHNAVKIAIYTENYMPDINNADYVIGHYHINYLDRYFKYSIFLWNKFKIIDEKRKAIFNYPIRKKFCAAVISNCFAQFRLKFIERLSKYKKVDMGGRCRNNINKFVKDKIEFLSEYKFSIAMENSDGDGYVSEKIVHAFLSGTLPIYYGDYIIDEFINPKTYILIKKEIDIEKKIEYIKLIDNDDNLYKKIMKEKPIIDDNFLNKIDKKEIKLFLKNIFRQDKTKAYRRDNHFYY